MINRRLMPPEVSGAGYIISDESDRKQKTSQLNFLKMKAVLMSSLTPEESANFRKSILYTHHILNSFEFTPATVDYNIEYFGPDYINTSILIYKNNEPVLALYSYSKENTFSYFSSPLSIISVDFENPHDEQAAHTALLNKLREVAKSHLYTKINFFENKFLLSDFYGKICDCDNQYEVFLDLSIDKEVLKSNIRKSYKSLINWGERNFNTHIMTAENIDYETFVSTRDFHRAVAGKITRSDRSWDLQYEAILNNEAYLVLANYNNELVSSTFVLHGKRKAYYGVGVYNRELMAKDMGLAHYNLLYAIYHAKSIGLKEFELGYLSQKNTNEKESKIFHFKTGFTKLMRSKNSFTATL